MRSPRSSLKDTPRNSGVPAMSLSSADAITTAICRTMVTHVAVRNRDDAAVLPLGSVGVNGGVDPDQRRRRREEARRRTRQEQRRVAIASVAGTGRYMLAGVLLLGGSGGEGSEAQGAREQEPAESFRVEGAASSPNGVLVAFYGAPRRRASWGRSGSADRRRPPAGSSVRHDPTPAPGGRCFRPSLGAAIAYSMRQMDVFASYVEFVPRHRLACRSGVHGRTTLAVRTRTAPNSLGLRGRRALRGCRSPLRARIARPVPRRKQRPASRGSRTNRDEIRQKGPYGRGSL